MKHLKFFETYLDRENFLNNKSEYVTTITCIDGNDNTLTFTYNGKDGDHYYRWYNDTNYITLITLVRNPGIGDWNPAIGTGAYLDINYNYGSGQTQEGYKITSRTTVSSSSDYYEEPLVYIAEIKAINAYSGRDGKNVWYEYAGEFDVYQGQVS